MATWQDNKATLTGILNILGYTEMKDNFILDLESPIKNKHKSYSLIPVGAFSDFSVAVAYQDIAELKVSYICKNAADVDKAFDEFKSVMTSINKHIGNLTDNLTFTRHPENANYYTGTANFILGLSC